MHERLVKRAGKNMWEHIRNVRWAIAKYLEDVPNSYLRFKDNQALFLFLTLKGDLKWHYRVDEMHLTVHDYLPWGRCYWCDWQPMGMSVTDLIDHLRLEAPVTKSF